MELTAQTGIRVELTSESDAQAVLDAELAFIDENGRLRVESFGLEMSIRVLAGRPGVFTDAQTIKLRLRSQGLGQIVRVRAFGAIPMQR